MDDQDDFDLYDDIIGGDEGAEVPPSNEEVTKWREEVADSKAKMKRLTEVNTELNSKCETIEKNMASLIKTARCEINRKNETIANLRRELEDVILRRTLKGGKPSEIREVTALLKDVLRGENAPKSTLDIPECKTRQSLKDTGSVHLLDNFAPGDFHTIKVGNTSFTTVTFGDCKPPMMSILRHKAAESKVISTAEQKNGAAPKGISSGGTNQTII
jgi:hypothetical protein